MAASRAYQIRTRNAERQRVLSRTRRVLRRGEVDEWFDATLALLEVNLENFLAAIRRGRERLQERSPETTVAGIRPDPTNEPA